ncbi:MAG: Nif3-like dinuclear metal center hexameric protein [Bacteroidia bacterium]
MPTSRRTFLKNTGLTLAAASLSGMPQILAHNDRNRRPDDMTIQEAIDTIIAEIPGGRKAQTVDTVKSSDPSQKLTGIVTTFLATVDVIRTAIKKGANLIITHEPTYYNHLDETDWLKNDPVYTYKRELLEKNNIVVWRFHDYWHTYRPDGILTGFLRDMKWESYVDDTNDNICVIPETTLEKLAKEFSKKLHLDRCFTVGNPSLTCKRIGLIPGAAGRQMQIGFLRQDIDVLVVGEVSEWETAEYVRDASQAGIKKGLIILGHAQSEEPGMAYLVDWLQDIIPDMPVYHVPATDPFRPV